MKIKKIHIASDHAGFELKGQVINELVKMGFEACDLGPASENSVDYPDYADKVSQAVLKDHSSQGVLICGSAQGMAMRANKYLFIRAALCCSEKSAHLARQHNDANILCLGSRMTSNETNIKILHAFFEETFEGGRHQRRVDKLSAPIPIEPPAEE